MSVLAALTLASSFAVTAPLAGAAASAAATATAADVPGDDIRDIRGPKGVFPLWLMLVSLAVVALLVDRRLRRSGAGSGAGNGRAR